MRPADTLGLVWATAARGFKSEEAPAAGAGGGPRANEEKDLGYFEANRGGGCHTGCDRNSAAVIKRPTTSKRRRLLITRQYCAGSPRQSVTLRAVHRGRLRLGGGGLRSAWKMWRGGQISEANVQGNKGWAAPWARARADGQAPVVDCSVFFQVSRR